MTHLTRQHLMSVVGFVVLLVSPLSLDAQTVSISPGYINIGVSGTVQYSATVTGLANTAVTWTVSGTPAKSGAITPAGLYTAPASVPTAGVTISALASDKKTSATVYVNIEPAGPTITSVSPNPIPAGTSTVTITGAGFKSGAMALADGASNSATFVNSTTVKVALYAPAGPVVFQIANPGTLYSAPFTATAVTPQTISPATATMNLGATKQFTSAGATSWTATAGTVSSTGLFTAPATLPTSKNATITATGPGGSASAIVNLNTPAPQTISPTTANVTLGATQQFTSAGATSWTATAGTISSTGLYTAPTTMPASSTVTVTATGPGGSASATVTLISGEPQKISPTAVNVNLGATQQFTGAGATTWTATAGTITTAGLYTAPTTMPASNKVTITASGPRGSASATVTLISAPIAQSISPTSASLALGATQQFTSSGATTWTATAGTVTTTGFYTAPATMTASGNATVTATGPNGSASAAITLIGPPPVITAVGNGTLPLGIFSTTISGTGFSAQSIARLNGNALSTTYANGGLTVVGFYGQSGMVNITVSNGAATSPTFLVQVGVQNALASAAASRRFLEQAAFGPTPNDAAHVQTIGMSAWLAEQFALPQISNYNTITGSQGGMPAHFLTNAVTNQDQLRQRVAFALSQVFVTSIDKLIWNDNMAPYQDMLLADSFTNYRQIMEDVTLSPAMGQYLDMANNAKANPLTGSLANENYARELMQLFTTGDSLLNLDGSQQLDANNLPRPTYLQSTIAEFARVYTGWTYAPKPGQSVYWGEYINTGNMVPYPAEHDMGAKTLLNGYISPAGATPQQDLDNALDNIFNHPNVGPFVAMQLIRKLVKSNPSPAYISRVASAFNDNGNGVRGDMKATVTAVLLDPEARDNDEGGKDNVADGHLQEPALYIAGTVRAFGGQMNDQNYYSSEMANLGQDIFSAPSVFNYYAPDYLVPGTTVLGGEFQIDTPNNAIERANMASGLMFSQYNNPLENYGPGTTVDLTPFVALAATPSTLVDALDLTLTHGTMPAAMKSIIVAAVNSDKGNGSVHQVQTAAYLILSSNFYNVWH